MNFLKTSTLILASLAFPVLSQAITFSTNFDSVPGANGTNFAPIGPWTINDSTTEVSFVQDVPGGRAVALGGFNSAPALQNVNLAASVLPGGIPTGGSVFTSRFAIINSGPGFSSATDPKDNFGFTLRDTNGGFFGVQMRPTSNVSIRQFFTSNSAFNYDPVTPNGMAASDFSAPSFVTMTLNFTQSGADLNWAMNVATSSTPINASGTLAGWGGRSWINFAIDYDVADPTVTGGLFQGAGSNVILVDSISLVPEPSAAMMGLLSIGLLGLRRRR